MLVIVSPAKKLNMSLVQGLKVSEPYFKENVDELVNVVRDLSVKELENLMEISTNLAELNKERFNEFGNQQKKAAVFAFAGDTYKGLCIEKLEGDDLDFAQKHLRILSGLYGLLRPLDEIEPYRLEMGCKLKGKHGSSLYEYWGNKISENLNQHAKTTGSKILVNCASNEYFNVININKLILKVITPIFMEHKNGKEKIISFYAKNARGSMARFIIQNRLKSEEDLKKFDLDGYNYNAEKSSEGKLVFIR